MSFQWTKAKKIKLLTAVAMELDLFWDGILVSLGPEFRDVSSKEISRQFHGMLFAAANSIPDDGMADDSSAAGPSTLLTESSQPYAEPSSYTVPTTAFSASPPVEPYSSSTGSETSKMEVMRAEPASERVKIDVGEVATQKSLVEEQEGLGEVQEGDEEDGEWDEADGAADDRNAEGNKEDGR